MASFANLTLPTRALLLGFANDNPAKHRAVVAVICDGDSYREAAKRAGVQPSTVHGWIREFRLLCHRLIETEGIPAAALVRAVDDEITSHPRPESQGSEGDSRPSGARAGRSSGAPNGRVENGCHEVEGRRAQARTDR